MKLNIVFLKSAKGFTKKEKRQIKNIIKNATYHAAKFLNLRDSNIINFTVYRFCKNYIGAFTQAEDLIYISIPRRKKINEKELKSTIYHEIHHVKRSYFGYSKKKTSLFDALFSEGLAIVFALEKVPEYVPKWSKYTKKFIEKWLLKIKKHNHKLTAEKLVNKSTKALLKLSKVKL